jgi:hypothetical protein
VEFSPNTDYPEVYRGSCHCFRQMPGWYIKTRPRPLLSMLLIMYTLIILTSDAIQPELLTTSLNKLRIFPARNEESHKGKPHAAFLVSRSRFEPSISRIQAKGGTARCYVSMKGREICELAPRDELSSMELVSRSRDADTRVT